VALFWGHSVYPINTAPRTTASRRRCCCCCCSAVDGSNCVIVISCNLHWTRSFVTNYSRRGKLGVLLTTAAAAPIMIGFWNRKLPDYQNWNSSVTRCVVCVGQICDDRHLFRLVTNRCEVTWYQMRLRHDTHVSSRHLTNAGRLRRRLSAVDQGQLKLCIEYIRYMPLSGGLVSNVTTYKPILYRNGWTSGAGFRGGDPPLIIGLHLIWMSPKYGYFPLEPCPKLRT